MKYFRAPSNKAGDMSYSSSLFSHRLPLAHLFLRTCAWHDNPRYENPRYENPSCEISRLYKASFFFIKKNCSWIYRNYLEQSTIQLFWLFRALSAVMLIWLLSQSTQSSTMIYEDGPRSSLEFSDCADKSYKSLQRNWPHVVFNPEDLKMTLEFDCNQAKKIHSITEPVSTAHPVLLHIQSMTLQIPHGFIRDSIAILKPYCQNSHEIYGSYCMALDVDAAAELTRKKNILDLIPQAITELGNILARQSSVDFYQVLDEKLPREIPDRPIVIATLAGFLGLDNNALQADRLKANLLFEKRLDDYAKVFPYLTQYTIFPLQDGVGRGPSHDFLAILFSTRSGQARLTGLATDQKETYKAYAGFYLGCRLAQTYKKKRLIAEEAFALGFSYELTKLKFLSFNNARRFLLEAVKMHQKGIITGKMMQTGARLGYQICSRAPIQNHPI